MERNVCDCRTKCYTLHDWAIENMLVKFSGSRLLFRMCAINFSIMLTSGMVFANTLDQKHCFSALNSLVMTPFYLNQTPNTAFGEALYLCYCHLPPFDRFNFQILCLHACPFALPFVSFAPRRSCALTRDSRSEPAIDREIYVLVFHRLCKKYSLKC